MAFFHEVYKMSDYIGIFIVFYSYFTNVSSVNLVFRKIKLNHKNQWVVDFTNLKLSTVDLTCSEILSISWWIRFQCSTFLIILIFQKKSYFIKVSFNGSKNWSGLRKTSCVTVLRKKAQANKTGINFYFNILGKLSIIYNFFRMNDNEMFLL